jgi:hypothetical protein
MFFVDSQILMRKDGLMGILTSSLVRHYLQPPDLALAPHTNSIRRNTPRWATLPPNECRKIPLSLYTIPSTLVDNFVEM